MLEGIYAECMVWWYQAKMPLLDGCDFKALRGSRSCFPAAQSLLTSKATSVKWTQTAHWWKNTFLSSQYPSVLLLLVKRSFAANQTLGPSNLPMQLTKKLMQERFTKVLDFRTFEPRYVFRKTVRNPSLWWTKWLTNVQPRLKGILTPTGQADHRPGSTPFTAFSLKCKTNSA